MSPASGRMPIHLVPHTHWDREWYRPFQGFRMQLVDLVDRVLDMLDAEPDFAFTLDGQLATVDDYLEIRPGAADRIRRHVRDGRLAIGPWLILMDEFLVSGETLVRNLEAGWSRALDFGQPMPVGYLPDMFGHVAQMPQLLRRAGIADAVVWRGIPSAIERHRFRWESPDGSWVRAEYLPAGYGNAAAMFAVPDQLEAAAARFVKWAEPWFGDDPVLAMYGTDHTAPVPELAALVGRLNEISDTSSIAIGTLAGYMAAAPALDPSDPCWRGELRSGARANVLMGVVSARIDLKQAAGRAERALERLAEPLFALHVHPDAWPAPFLDLAWRRVIENSAHDSICGCSVDPVIAQVLVRFAEADQVGTALAGRAVAAVADGVPRGAVAVVSPTPWPRSGAVEVELVVPDDWGDVAFELPDGSRVATQELARKEPILLDEAVRGADVGDLFRRFHGREVFDHAWNGFRIEGRTLTLEVDDDPDPPWLDVDGLRAEVTAALLAAPDVTWQVRVVARARRTLSATVAAPALGWTALRPVEAKVEPTDPVRIDADGRGMRNDLVSVLVAEDGTLTISTADGTTTAAGIGRIVDGGDAGDSYNYAPPTQDREVDVPEAVEVRTELDGPIVGRLAVVRRYAWPRGLADGIGGRADATIGTVVRSDVELHAGEPFMRLAIAFDNQADDHRVRLHAPLPRRADRSAAEGQFAVVERGTTPEGGYREEPLATYPAHGWVDAGGLAVLLDHLVEYELVDGTELAVTLLRSTGLISRNDNPYRMDPAGPEIAIPDAQMRGPHRITFGLLPHAGGWREGRVVEAAERYRQPLLARPGAAIDAPWPPDGAGEDALRIDGGGDVVLTSLRRRDDEWLEARVVNLAPAARRVSLHGAIEAAREADLRGTPGDPIAADGDGAVVLDLGAAEIRTIQLRRRVTATARADVLDAGGPRQRG